MFELLGVFTHFTKNKNKNINRSTKTKCGKRTATKLSDINMNINLWPPDRFMI